MNTYVKYCPNVFVAKCEEQHEKGDIITVTTKYGKENECEVHNQVAEKDGFFYYSITRTDEYNHAKAKAEKYRKASLNASQKAHEYFVRANKDRDFLSLGEPIKVGHHSERKHRKAIEDAWNNTGKGVEHMDKAEEYLKKAERWENREDDINLSMPESLEYFSELLEQAREYHTGLKSGKYPKEHSFSMAYANKNVKDLEKKVELAKRLWG